VRRGARGREGRRGQGKQKGERGRIDHEGIGEPLSSPSM